MEIKNTIIHFPWGAGGNFIRNCLLLDDCYEFDGQHRDTLARYNFLMDYYQQELTQDTWLAREWSGPRGYLYNTYYNTPGIINWSTKNNVIYLNHCQDNEMQSIMDNILLDLKHVFLMPTNLQLIAEIYVSKNPEDTGHLCGNTVEKIKNTTLYIKYLKENQTMLAEQLKKQNQPNYIYDVDYLFDNNGFELILDIANHLLMNVPRAMAQDLHRLWINKTKFVYNNFFSNHSELSPTLLEWK
jgi:hypothetical protein